MKNEPAFPENVSLGDYGRVTSSEHKGLTKRELFAAMAMQGILGNPETADQVTSSSDIPKIGQVSILFADALLQELEK